jgi:hypothetical protein
MWMIRFILYYQSLRCTGYILLVSLLAIVLLLQIHAENGNTLRVSMLTALLAGFKTTSKV